MLIFYCHAIKNTKKPSQDLGLCTFSYSLFGCVLYCYVDAICHRVCYALPRFIRDTNFIDSFKTKLKTYLFEKAFLTT